MDRQGWMSCTPGKVLPAAEGETSSAVPCLALNTAGQSSAFAEGRDQPQHRARAAHKARAGGRCKPSQPRTRSLLPPLSEGCNPAAFPGSPRMLPV